MYATFSVDYFITVWCVPQIVEAELQLMGSNNNKNNNII